MIRIGIIGMGNIGNIHLNNILRGKIKNARVTAICSRDRNKVDKIIENSGSKIRGFTDEDEFFKSRSFDGVIICTPHFSHTKQSKKALENGYHVLCEKPIGVYTKEVDELIKVSKETDKKFGIMYNQRTNPLYKKVKEMVDEGRVGEIRRSNWIVTDWYRTQAYYDSTDWRATWGGEGGGVLLNQAPHQLDLWQWLCGMPIKIRGFCNFGKRRKIEVEDEVTIYAEYSNGATGVFVTTTSECPGTNRLEIVGSRGTIVVENGKIRFYELSESEDEFNRRCKIQEHDENGEFIKPEFIIKYIEVDEKKESGHITIMNNWIESITDDTPMIARGEEGIRGLTISNAAYLSTFKDRWVELPIDKESFAKELSERIEASVKK